MSTFHKVGDPTVLLPLLQERHPLSCFTSDQVVAISASPTIASGKEPISNDVKDSFSYGEVIIWDEKVIFAALAKPISAMIFDVGVNVKGRVTSVHPCLLFYMEKEDALRLDTSCNPDFEVGSLAQEGGIDFVMATWVYAKEALRKVLKKCTMGYASAGVYVNGKCVSGVINREVGMLAALHTVKEQRNRGMGKLTMKHAFKETAKLDCIPCCTAEISNARAVAFNMSLGVRTAAPVDWMDVHKLSVD